MLVIKVGKCINAELCYNIITNCKCSSSVFILLWHHAQVSAESANQFGELIADPITKELLHYTEKPETFVCTMCTFCAKCCDLIGA